MSIVSWALFKGWSRQAHVSDGLWDSIFVFTICTVEKPSSIVPAMTDALKRSGLMYTY